MRLAALILVCLCSWAKSADGGLFVNETPEALRAMLTELRETPDFKQSSPERQQDQIALYRRLFWFKICLSKFLESPPSERARYGTETAVKNFKDEGVLKLQSVEQLAPEMQPLAEGQNEKDIVANITKAKFYTANVIVEDAAHEIKAFRLLLHERNGRAYVTSVEKNVDFSAPSFRLKEQNNAVAKHLENALSQSVASRGQDSDVLATLFPSEKYLLRRTHNIRGELFLKPDQTIEYAVDVRDPNAANPQAACLFSILGMKRMGDQWRVVSVKEDAQLKSSFQEKIKVAEFIERFLKSTGEERAALRTTDAVVTLPKSGAVWPEIPVDPYLIVAKKEGIWEVSCVLRHANKFDHIGRERLRFVLRVIKDTEGNLKISQEMTAR